MQTKSLFLTIPVLMLLSFSAFAQYSVIDRYSVKEDRFQTEEMLRPLGHDFLIDLNAAMSDGITDLIDGAEAVSKSSNQLTEAQNFLAAENNNEHMARVHAEFGVPIFSFTAWGVKIVPDFRFGANGPIPPI